MKTALESFLKRGREWLFLCLPVVAAAVAMAACETQQKPPDVIVLVDDSGNVSDGRVNFKTQIAPLLETRCVTCHYDHAHLTALSFQRRDSMLEENAERPVLVPGDAEGSTLFLVTVMPEYFVEAMPPTGHRLSDAEASRLYRWISQGAEWPKDLVLKPAPES